MQQIKTNEQQLKTNSLMFFKTATAVREICENVFTAICHDDHPLNYLLPRCSCRRERRTKRKYDLPKVRTKRLTLSPVFHGLFTKWLSIYILPFHLCIVQLLKAANFLINMVIVIVSHSHSHKEKQNAYCVPPYCCHLLKTKSVSKIHTICQQV